MRPFYEWQSLGQFYIDHVQPGDKAAIEAMVERHQGEESLGATRHWLARQPQGFSVFRAAGDAIVGFSHVVDISQLEDADMAADPAMRAAIAHVQRLGMWRSGGRLVFFRNWMDAERHQQSPAVFNMTSMASLRVLFGTTDLAYSLMAQTNSQEYASMYGYLRLPLAPDAQFVMDGQTFGVFVHDWRAEPVLQWIEFMGERELLDEIVALDNLPRASEAVVLSEPEFADAVRQALKDVRRPDLLLHSPLLRSRCLRERSDQAPTPAQLQALLREGAQILTANPRTHKLHRVLWHTYFEPAPGQEAAAELLDLPFSTYRYQLGKAVAQITAWLWQQEIYGVDA